MGAPTFITQIDLARALVNHANVALVNASALVPGSRERSCLDAIQKAMIRMEVSLDTFLKTCHEIEAVRTISKKPGGTPV